MFTDKKPLDEEKNKKKGSSSSSDDDIDLDYVPKDLPRPEKKQQSSTKLPPKKVFEPGKYFNNYFYKKVLFLKNKIYKGL